MSQIGSPGLEVSILPPSKAERTNRQDTLGLVAANNSPIVTYGTRSLTLNRSGRDFLEFVAQPQVISEKAV